MFWSNNVANVECDMEKILSFVVFPKYFALFTYLLGKVSCGNFVADGMTEILSHFEARMIGFGLRKDNKLTWMKTTSYTPCTSIPLHITTLSYRFVYADMKHEHGSHVANKRVKLMEIDTHTTHAKHKARNVKSVSRNSLNRSTALPLEKISIQIYIL